jgi:alkylhydroperoxidase/carboxymuconolactone decarboxylase family protein YurZ
MLNKHQHVLYDAFYQSTHSGQSLDQKTETLVGLAAAMAMNCQPCTGYYLRQAKQAEVSSGEISEVLAKVMAVAAGQKRLQAQQAFDQCNIHFDSSE